MGIFKEIFIFCEEGCGGIEGVGRWRCWWLGEVEEEEEEEERGEVEEEVEEDKVEECFRLLLLLLLLSISLIM